MKKIFIFALMIMMINNSVGLAKWKTKGYTNLRKEPNTECEILWTYSPNVPLEIIGVDSTGKWWQTWDTVTQGWIRSDLLYDDSVEDVDYVNANNMRYLGQFKATYYTPSWAENGSYHTASGKLLSDGVAVDSSVIPLGSKLWIDGIGVRYAEDTGGAIKGKRLDILTWNIPMAGITYHDVYIIE